jgi:hypothetical protein
MLNCGIRQPNYHQGKKLLNEERMRNNIKTYEGKACFLSTYHPTTFTIL